MVEDVARPRILSATFDAEVCCASDDGLTDFSILHARGNDAGAVAAREVSRFARNSRDWQQLIEMCRVRRLDHHRHVPQLDLFRPATPTLEWRQLPAEVRGKAARHRRSGEPVMGHATLERVLLIGTRSADYIRASGHNGCI